MKDSLSDSGGSNHILIYEKSPEYEKRYPGSKFLEENCFTKDSVISMNLVDSMIDRFYHILDIFIAKKPQVYFRE